MRRILSTPTLHQVSYGRRFLSSSVSRDGRLTLFVSCIPGLEPVLSNELASLNIPHSPTKGGVNLRQASVESIQKCHLWVGSASHVLVRCGKAFNVRGFPELTRKVARMPWHLYLEENATVKVKATCSKSKLYHSNAIEQRVEAAIDKAFGRQGGDGPVVSLNVRVHRDVVQISMDTSSTPMHQRGYRFETAKAPLREDIAYSMLYATGWKDNYGGLLDPFCGSGTIAIEAAAMKLGLPPGRLREAPLLGSVFHSPDEWNDLLCQALEASQQQSNGDNPRLVVAGDRDSGAVQAATANADRAGVLPWMDITTRSISDHDWFAHPDTAPSSLLVVTNPPFGKRISSSRKKTSRRFDELLPLYQTLGNKISGLIKSPSSNDVGAAVLTNNIDLTRRMSLPDNKALFSTQHGGLPVVAMGANLKHRVLQ